VPKRGATEGDVARATATVADARARHFWDGSGFSLHAFRSALGLPFFVDAWDVYLIYGPDVRWDATAPPAPDFWMHQLSHAPGARLDPAAFGTRLAQMVEAVPREPR